MTTPEEATVLPIALEFSARTGYTIWAPPWLEDGEEWQAFLGAEGRVWLFESLDDLAATLASGLDNDLSDHPGWPMLQTLPAAQLAPEEDYWFDLAGLPELTEAEAETRVVGQVAKTVDIVARIAECCEHGTLLRLLEQPGFADLLDLDEEAGEPDTGGAGEDGSDGEPAQDADGGPADEAEDDAWAEIGAAIRTSWPLLLDRLDDCVEWRAAADLPEPSAAGATVVSATAGAPAIGEGAADEEFWNSVGIMPVEVRLSSGLGYTLRCYVDDEARFLGSDLMVEVFRSTSGLAGFCVADEEHDLAGLETWDQVRERSGLDTTPPAGERYDLTVIDVQLIGGPAVADHRQVRAAVDLALDLAEYCELAGVQAALADDAPLGAAVSDLLGASRGGGIMPAYWSGEGAAAQWRQALEEIDSCVRWHD